MQRKNIFPKMLLLHITNKCNMLCRHCVYDSGIRKLDEMSLKTIVRIIKEYSEITFGSGIIGLIGGEPLVRKEIFQIIEEINKTQLLVRVTTNGNFSEKYLMKLLKYKIDRVTLSLGGVIPQTHDWLVNKKDHFYKVIDNIKLFKSKGIFTAVNIVLHKNNIFQVVPLLELFISLNIDNASFLFFTPIGRGKNISEMVVSPKLWLNIKKEVMKWIKKRSPNFGINWEQSYISNNKLNSQHHKRILTCQKGSNNTFFVRCDGQTYSCALLEGAPCSPGNLKNFSLGEILNRKDKYAFNGKFIGCPALSYHINGKLDGKDPRILDDNIVLGCPFEYETLNKLKKI